MSESNKNSDLSPSHNPPSHTQTKSSPWPFKFLIYSFVFPIAIATLIYQLDSFDPAHLPPHELTRDVVAVPKRNGKMLQGSEYVGVGKLLAAEDLAYDSESGLIYTGCSDGWVKRVTVNDSADDSVVESWVFTGGRPLGLALGIKGEVIVADTEKGLVRISKEGAVEVVAEEAEGVKFKLTDGVDVAEDGMIYFTDASYKYSFKDFIYDIFELKPHGRLLSYDPVTKHTSVLLRDLYFANGVAVSPDQNYIIFCETPLRRCRKYYIEGDRKGSVEKFVENLPGVPDNIRYDGEGHYWIGLSTEMTNAWYLTLRYPAIRKIMAIMERYTGRPQMGKNGGVLAVNLEGQPIAHYYDSGMSFISSGLKIGNYLYCGSITYPYLIRLNLDKYPAQDWY